MKSNESGMAIITALLVLMLASGLMAGMFAALIADQRSHATDRDQSVAYAAAHAGLEKLTASLARALRHRLQPQRRATSTLIDNLPPAIPSFEFTSPGGGAGSGYAITFTPDPGPGANTGNPLAFPSSDITTGPLRRVQGPDHALHADRHRQVDDRQLRSAAAPRAADGGRAGVPVRHLRREVARLPRRPELRLRRPRPHQRRACYLAPRHRQHR